MKIAVNCVYFGQKSGGLGEYILNLCKNLMLLDQKNEYIFYISRDQEYYWNEKLQNLKNYKLVPFNLSQQIRRSLFQNSFWNKEEKIEQFDIFHSPFYHLPTSIKCKKIITFHDLRIKNYPWTYPIKRRFFIQYAIKKSISIADKIITVSNFTKNELINFYQLPQEKIVPIHEGIDTKKFNNNKISEENEKKFLLLNKLETKGYLLSVGHIEPRKNYKNLIKSYKLLREKYKIEYKLVIVGKKNFKYKGILRMIESDNSIVYFDFVSQEDLIFLYKNAFLFVFPSFYEGFGFPPLEAAALNLPSVVSNITSIPEICSSGALYFNPFDINDISNKIYLLISNKNIYEKILILSKENLKRFNWKMTTKKTIQIYQKIKNVEF